MAVNSSERTAPWMKRMASSTGTGVGGGEGGAEQHGAEGDEAVSRR